MGSVYYDPDSVIIPDDGALYVINRTGISGLKSRNIDKVHGILKPHIDSAPDEDALLGAIPPSQRATLQTYLEGLYRLGAIRFSDRAAPSDQDNKTASLLAAALGQGARGSLTTCGQRVFVSLNGIIPSEIHSHDLCIFFAKPREVGRELVVMRRLRGKMQRSIVYVAVEGSEPTEGSATGRFNNRDYASWLLQSERQHSQDASAVRVYALNSTTGALTQLLSIDPTSSPEIQAIPQRLGLIQPAPVNQVPLVVATESHPLFDISRTLVGLRYEILCEELLSEFIVESALSESSSLHFARPEARTLGPEKAKALTPVVGQEPSRWRIARSLLHLRIGLLEECFARHWEAWLGQSSEVDLLAEGNSHPEIEYLKSVLRLRVNRMPARLTETPDNLFVYQYSATFVFSLLRMKALRDVLLAAVLENFYPARPVDLAARQHTCDFASFADDATLRDLAEKSEPSMARVTDPRRFVYRKARRWGRTVWFGRIE
ncbi:MAG TPA: hypothetical protein VFV34_15540 [Blastocatellia bacterium]|nr:hypothetical protein [Blastocatellia bacterium]